MPSKELQTERELLSPPGDTIFETIEYLKMSQSELAQRLKKTTSKVNDLISGKEPITYSTALQLEKVLGIDAEFWMNREMNYRIKLTRLEQDEALEDVKEWIKQQPIKQLQKCGYIKSQKIDAEMAKEFYEFYGVVDINVWQTKYVDHFANASYRKNDNQQTALAAMAAWLRIGELEMQKMQLPQFDKEGFKNVLEEVKELVASHPTNFAQQLQAKCAAVGVAIVYTMCLPKAPVSGAARWFRGNPLIQLTDRHKTNDNFWFTFYHEAGHILLHGKKEVFFEEFEAYKADLEKEEEANSFAARHLLPEMAIEELPFRFTEEDIIAIAEKYDTHPAIVVGRVQHLKMAPYTFGYDLKEKVSLFKAATLG